ncbi:MAG: ATP-dependent DNA helicase, partial [Acidobacteriaceae bacterium]
MPLPSTTEPSTDRKLPRLEEFFSPGGILSRSGLPYEYRPGQLEMARAMERAFTGKRHLIVEAGTGTGKTLAYLLPALRLGQRVIVSTGTRNLQEQIFFKDIPFLESLLGPLKVSYMKGRGNYLCRQKLYALRDQPILTGIDMVDQFNTIRDWEKTTEHGDRAELTAIPENSPLWGRLDARGEACLGSTCPNYEPCFITQMRRRALESDIVIVNHHLFFADLAIRRQTQNAPDAGVLPEAAAVVFDEAHELEEIASSYFGVNISNLRFEELARDVEILLRAKQALSASLTAAAELVRERSRMFFAALPEPKGAEGRMPFADREEFLEQSGDVYLGLVNALERLTG